MSVVIAANDANCFYSPGVWEVNSTHALSDLPGAYTKAGFTGTSINQGVDVTSFGALSGAYYPTVAYSIDNRPWVPVQLTPGMTSLFNVTGLAGGSHTRDLIWLYGTRTLDAWVTPVNTVTLTGMTVDDGASSVAPSLLSGRAMFFGDSTLAGLAAGATTTDDNSMYSYWGAIAAALGAEAGVVGVGNWGWASTGGGGQPIFPDAWNYYYDGHARVIPALDWAFVTLGTNDERGGVPAATIRANAAAWLPVARAAFGPSTRIVINVPYGGFASAPLTAAVSDYRAAAPSDRQVYLVDLGAPGYAGLTNYEALGTQQSNDGIHANQIRGSQLGAMYAKEVTRLTTGGLSASVVRMI